MARVLTFQSGKSSFEAGLRKIDRSKLYGSVRVETFDHKGQECDLVTLARDGRTVIPLGGTATGYLNTEGKWVEGNARKPVDPEGKELQEVASSFDAPIVLKETATPEDLLDHPVRLAYLLEATEVPAALTKELADGKIYRFGFSWRGGAFADPAFLLADEEGDLWMLVGNAAAIDFVEYSNAAVCRSVAEEDSEDDNDQFDFDML